MKNIMKVQLSVTCPYCGEVMTPSRVIHSDTTIGDDYVRCAVWGEDIRKDGYCYCGKRKKGEE